MSESKKNRQTNLWAMNLSSPDNPLLKCLVKESQASNVIHADGTINKSRLIEDLTCEALQVRFQKRGDMEGLGLLSEHNRRRAVKVALETGQPLPAAAAPIPQISPTQETSTSTSEPAPAPILTQPQPTSTPKPPEKKRRIEGTFTIGASGHMKKTGE